jgi:hypothetical protein
MEAYSGDTLSSIFKSMEVLGDFPAQVLVLKGTRTVCALRGRRAGLQARLIDVLQTAEFPEYISNLRKARQGHRELQSSLLDIGKEATAHLERMLDDARKTGSAIEAIATLYSKEERRSVRIGEMYSEEFLDKTTRNIMMLSAQLFRRHPDRKMFPSYAELANTFVFRAALCGYLLFLRWAATGGVSDAKPQTLRNDVVDINFAAYGTYFDGLMTADKKVREIHDEARVWLTALFGCDLPSGWQGRQP